MVVRVADLRVGDVLERQGRIVSISAADPEFTLWIVFSRGRTARIRRDAIIPGTVVTGRGRAARDIIQWLR